MTCSGKNCFFYQTIRLLVHLTVNLFLVEFLFFKKDLLQAALLGVDILMNPERIPPLTKDYYWDKQNCPIPYTQVRHFGDN